VGERNERKKQKNCNLKGKCDKERFQQFHLAETRSNAEKRRVSVDVQDFRVQGEVEKSKRDHNSGSSKKKESERRVRKA